MYDNIIKYKYILYIFLCIMLVSYDAFLQNIISHICAQPNDDFAS